MWCPKAALKINKRKEKNKRKINERKEVKNRHNQMNKCWNFIGHNDSQLQGIYRCTIKNKWKESIEYFEQRSKSGNYQVQKLNL